MKQVAFVTHSGQPEIAKDDRVTASILAQRGVGVVGVAWDDTSVRWEQFDLIVIRSAWNYHEQPDAFRKWVQTLQNMAVPLLNPPATVLWNIHKGYLKDLQQMGVQIFDTVWIEQGAQCNLEKILKEQNWQEAVVKPAISAGAHLTFRTSSADFSTDIFQKLILDQDMLVQKFCPELVRDGELSLVFFHREYSHMIRSTPLSQDFRIQEKYGGTYSVEAASADLIDQAGSILNCVPGEILYARVDGAMVGDTFYLNELELIEPSLAVSSSDSGAARFASAISASI